MSTTAPVVKDNFASANGDFYAEASGSNRHRRAAPSELKSHFNTTGSEKDKPAHWYEAQLIHYGLPPSKTKSVAFKRLFEAVRADNLSVPSHIVKVEAELKKEWTKRDREAKKDAKGQMLGVKKTTEKATAVKKTAGQKRKADEVVDLMVSVGGINVTLSARNSPASQTATKKAKTASTTTATATKTVKPSPKAKAAPKTTKPAATPKDKTIPAKTTPKPKPAPKATTSTSQPKPAPRTKQTARCTGRGGLLQGPNRGAAVSSPAQPSRPLQTARRGGSFASRGSHAHSFPQGRRFSDDDKDDDDSDDGDEPPPPYSGYEHGDSSSSSSRDDQPLAKLGLLNGRYEIESRDVSEQWPHLGNDLGLILTLNGNELWGSFDLGVLEGILRFDVRPYESSHVELDFKWRGRENEGEIICGNYNNGWIRFLGGGRIEGWLDRLDIGFSGQRSSGQGTRSEVDARTMMNEWDGYSEQEYERENRARWGGSSWW
ncbi:hypothetical protein SUNI508_03522 [Seiridium unicorne]|uniref:Uncharacterized protein n=1 Tax=Seiridium unicorne TaxID=138068 RepID=A0ABR2VDP2_9PEZI